jgi:hypothetical protein
MAVTTKAGRNDFALRMKKSTQLQQSINSHHSLSLTLIIEQCALQSGAFSPNKEAIVSLVGCFQWNQIP